jgi:hypothetical protein
MGALPTQPTSPKARITEHIATNNFLMEHPFEIARVTIVIIPELITSAERPHFPSNKDHSVGGI